MKTLLTQREVASHFNVSDAAVRKWIKTGRLSNSVKTHPNGAFKGISLSEAILDVENFNNTKSCLNCGKPIGEGLKRYCSKECSGRYMFKKCDQCGTEYYATETRQKFCSKECSHKGKSSIGRQPNPKPISRCAFCGKSFTKNSYYHKCCSTKCSSALRVESRKQSSKPKICGYCQAEFRSNRIVYCSEECARAARNKKRKLSDNITSQSLYLRDKFTCIYCGQSSIEDGVRLSADHIIPFDNGGTHSIDNLVTCCKKCNSAKCNSMFDNDILNRVQAVVIKRNELLSTEEKASIKELARRMETFARYNR